MNMNIETLEQQPPSYFHGQTRPLTRIQEHLNEGSTQTQQSVEGGKNTQSVKDSSRKNHRKIEQNGLDYHEFNRMSPYVIFNNQLRIEEEAMFWNQQAEQLHRLAENQEQKKHIINYLIQNKEFKLANEMGVDMPTVLERTFKEKSSKQNESLIHSYSAISKVSQDDTEPAQARFFENQTNASKVSLKQEMTHRGVKPTQLKSANPSGRNDARMESSRVNTENMNRESETGANLTKSTKPDALGSIIAKEHIGEIHFTESDQDNKTNGRISSQIDKIERPEREIEYLRQIDHLKEMYQKQQKQINELMKLNQQQKPKHQAPFTILSDNQSTFRYGEANIPLLENTMRSQVSGMTKTTHQPIQHIIFKDESREATKARVKSSTSQNSMKIMNNKKIQEEHRSSVISNFNSFSQKKASSITQNNITISKNDEHTTSRNFMNCIGEVHEPFSVVETDPIEQQELQQQLVQQMYASKEKVETGTQPEVKQLVHQETQMTIKSSEQAVNQQAFMVDMSTSMRSGDVLKNRQETKEINYEETSNRLAETSRTLQPKPQEPKLTKGAPVKVIQPKINQPSDTSLDKIARLEQKYDSYSESEHKNRNQEASIIGSNKPIQQDLNPHEFGHARINIRRKPRQLRNSFKNKESISTPASYRQTQEASVKHETIKSKLNKNFETVNKKGIDNIKAQTIEYANMIKQKYNYDQIKQTKKQEEVSKTKLDSTRQLVVKMPIKKETVQKRNHGQSKSMGETKKGGFQVKVISNQAEIFQTINPSQDEQEKFEKIRESTNESIVTQQTHIVAIKEQKEQKYQTQTSISTDPNLKQQQNINQKSPIQIKRQTETTTKVKQESTLKTVSKHVTGSSVTIRTQGDPNHEIKTEQIKSRKHKETIGRKTMTTFKKEQSLLKQVQSIEEHQELIQSQFTSFQAMEEKPSEDIPQRLKTKQHTGNASMFSHVSRVQDSGRMKRSIKQFQQLISEFESLLKQQSQGVQPNHLQSKLSLLSERFRTQKQDLDQLGDSSICNLLMNQETALNNLIYMIQQRIDTPSQMNPLLDDEGENELSRNQVLMTPNHAATVIQKHLRRYQSRKNQTKHRNLSTLDQVDVVNPESGILSQARQRQHNPNQADKDSSDIRKSNNESRQTNINMNVSNKRVTKLHIQNGDNNINIQIEHDRAFSKLASQPIQWEDMHSQKNNDVSHVDLHTSDSYYEKSLQDEIRDQVAKGDYGSPYQQFINYQSEGMVPRKVPLKNQNDKSSIAKVQEMVAKHQNHKFRANQKYQPMLVDDQVQFPSLKTSRMKTPARNEAQLDPHVSKVKTVQLPTSKTSDLQTGAIGTTDSKVVSTFDDIERRPHFQVGTNLHISLDSSVPKDDGVNEVVFVNDSEKGRNSVKNMTSKTQSQNEASVYPRSSTIHVNSVNQHYTHQESTKYIDSLEDQQNHVIHENMDSLEELYPPQHSSSYPRQDMILQQEYINNFDQANLDIQQNVTPAKIANKKKHKSTHKYKTDALGSKSERKNATSRAAAQSLKPEQMSQTIDPRQYQSQVVPNKKQRFSNYSTLSKKNAVQRVSSTNIERSPDTASKPNLQFSNSGNPQRKLKQVSQQDRNQTIQYPLPNAQSFKPETFKKVNEYLRQVGYVPNSTNSIISINKINDSRVHFGQSQPSLKSQKSRMHSNESEGQNDSGSRRRLPNVEYNQRQFLKSINEVADQIQSQKAAKKNKKAPKVGSKGKLEIAGHVFNFKVTKPSEQSEVSQTTKNKKTRNLKNMAASVPIANQTPNRRANVSQEPAATTRQPRYRGHLTEERFKSKNGFVGSKISAAYERDLYLPTIVVPEMKMFKDQQAALRHINNQSARLN